MQDELEDESYQASGKLCHSSGIKERTNLILDSRRCCRIAVVHKEL